MNIFAKDGFVFMNGLLFFPSLHPALAGTLPPGVRLLDPGLGASEADGTRLRPEALPLTPEELAGYVREFDRLRREVKNPKDLALLAGTAGGHFFTDTSFAVREELADSLHPERVAARRAREAQLALCLTYMIEDSLLELAGAGELDARFHRAMAESLGLAAEDADEELALALAGTASLPSATSLAEEFRPSWRRTVSPFWAIAPEGAGLFVRDPDMVATVLDADLPFAAATGDQLAALFPEGAPGAHLLVATLPGWRLLGKTRPDPEAPWLDRPRTIVLETS